MGNIYFTSDTHFSHENIIKYCNRPFANVVEMDRVILDNIFKTLKEGDTLYHLGDVSFREDVIFDFNAKLFVAGIKVFYVRGNHDRFPKGWYPLPNILDISIEGQKITLCHFAMRTWNCSCHGAWNLFGHSHGKLKPSGKQWDVGVDNNGFMPVSFDKIKEVMESLPDNEDLVK